MRPVEIVMRVTAAVVFSAASLAAQAPPDFSGRWALAPEPPAAPAGRGGRTPSGSLGSGWGADITVTQDATTITIEYAPFARSDMQPPTRFIYRLDGSRSRNTINMGRGPQEQVSTAAWDGNRLVITTSQAFTPEPGGAAMTSETRQILSLESPAVLVVETTRSAVMGGQSSTTKAIYKKN